MALPVVTANDIGTGLAINAGKLMAKLGAGLKLDANNGITLDPMTAPPPAVTLSLAGEVLTVTVNGVSANQDITSAITALYTSTAFVEAVQDAVGAAIAAGAGLTYNDALNAISSALGNVAFSDGLSFAAGAVKVVGDPTSPLPVTVSPTGVKVALPTQAQLATLLTVDVQDLAGNHLCFALP